MSQQLGIIVLIDVASALQTRSLDNNTYLFDNMKLQGSEGEGTDHLVTAINGSYWSDGSQGSEEVLNWLPYSLGSIPPTVPRNFQADIARRTDEEALRALADVADLAGRSGTTVADLAAALQRIQGSRGARTRVKTARRPATQQRTVYKMLDVTGEVIKADAKDKKPTLNNRAPVITAIRGEAVDSKIMYPALYGSPDLVTDGWYWSASVDTSRPGTYAYTMEIQLHELIVENDQWTWEPVDLTCESSLRITAEPKRNAFTRAGLGMLPVPVA